MRAFVFAAALLLASALPAAAYPMYVFFDSGSTELTVEGRALIADFLKVYEEVQGTKILLEGHTDSLEAANADAVTLSLRRVEVVKQELVRLGIKAEEISLRALANTNPAVPTGPRQAEPQNRRVYLQIADGNLQADPNQPPPIG